MEKRQTARFEVISGAEGVRTPDLLNAIQTRSQLRHSPNTLYSNNSTFPVNRLFREIRTGAFPPLVATSPLDTDPARSHNAS